MAGWPSGLSVVAGGYYAIDRNRTASIQCVYPAICTVTMMLEIVAMLPIAQECKNRLCVSAQINIAPSGGFPDGAMQTPIPAERPTPGNGYTG